MYKGMTMKQIVAEKQKNSVTYVPVTGTASLSGHESARNYKISGLLRGRILRGKEKIRVELPYDDKKSHDMRVAEFWRQASKPWESHFMPSYDHRLNNPSQIAAVKQPQKTIPSSYGQFYAFMHAMSAAFGSLQQ